MTNLRSRIYEIRRPEQRGGCRRQMSNDCLDRESPNAKQNLEDARTGSEAGFEVAGDFADTADALAVVDGNLEGAERHFGMHLAKTDIDIDLGVLRIGRALIVYLIVGFECTRAAQFFGRHGPDALPYLRDYLRYRPPVGGEDSIAAWWNVFDGKVGGQSFGRDNGEPKEIGVVARVVGLVVGVNGDEIDTDLVRYLNHQIRLQKVLPDVADLPFAGHLMGVIGAGR
jgi:hypothetical protein